MATTTGPRQWDPAEWQSHCEELLTMHYGVHVQLIPDRTNGDGGLEAYVAADGTAYQCYAPQNPLTIADQTAGQKRKITIDTQKLVDRTAKTVKLIGAGNTIREWVLLTPSFEDKSLLEHAHVRSELLRAIAPDHDWCHDEIRISVHTDRLFARELASLASVGLGVLGIVSEADAAAPVDMDTSFEDVLYEKLAVDPALGGNTTRLTEYANETLSAYFRGTTEMERLSRDAPSTFKAVNDCAGIVFEGLATALIETDSKQLVVVRTIRTGLATKLVAEAAGLQPSLAELLARYFVASWWLQCPLYLDPVSGANVA